MIIYAKQPIYYLIQNHQQKIKTLYISKELEKKEYSRLMKMNFELKRIPSDAAGKMCKNASHQGFLAEVSDFKMYDYQSFLGKEFFLTWQDEESVYLPASFAYFEKKEHNEMLYYWLVALAAQIKDLDDENV